jgi:hypothetical protein
VKDYKKHQLQKELRDAGASSAEIDELVPLASHLRMMEHHFPVGSNAKKATVRWQRILKPALFGVSGLVVGMLLVILSQSVSPTNVLYPLQNLSDNVAIAINPNHRADIMMKRALQVNELVADHADQGKVIATLADYTSKASAYKSTPGADYAAFEYCKSNLQHAASATTSPTIHRAITNSLQSLQSV